MRIIKTRLKTALLAMPGFEWACRRLTRGQVRTLMYHRFTQEPERQPRHMPLAEFERQLDYLLRCHDVRSADDQAAGRTEGCPRRGRPVAVITADDGYRDFYEVAFPALERRGMKATLFVTTGFVDGRIWMWWDKVEYILETTARRNLELSLGSAIVRGGTGTAGERRRLWAAIVPPLRFVPDERKDDLIRQLAEVAEVVIPAAPPSPYAAAGWAALAEMSTRGILLGAHTVNHPILTCVTPDRARAEIVGSRAELVAHQLPVAAWFAYPQGGPSDVNRETEEIVREAGFGGGYVAYWDPASRSPYRLPRYNVPRGFADFRWFCCGAEMLVLRLRQLLGRHTGVSADYYQGYGEAR